MGIIPGEAIAYEYFFFAANDFNRPNAINVTYCVFDMPLMY